METKSSPDDKIFYIKNSIIFSTNKTDLFISDEIPEIELPNETKNFLKNNKEIISKLEEIKNRPRKCIPLTGVIENFETISKFIENKTDKKKNFFKPDDDDYDFIEKTSQLDIVKQLSWSVNGNDVEKLKQKLNDYIEFASLDEKSKISNIEDQLNNENEILTNIKEDIKDYKSNYIITIEKKILSTQTQIDSILEKKKSLEEIFIAKSSISELENEIRNLQTKINEYLFKIEDSKISIEIIKSKISLVEDNMKMGKKKCPSIISFLATAGLIYWTSFSDCTYIKAKLKSKIRKINEKNLKIEKRIHKCKTLLNQKKSVQKTKDIELSRKQELTKNKIEELEIIKDKKEKEIIELKKELEKKEKVLNEKLDTEKDQILEIEKLKSIKREFETYSCSSILELIMKIDEDKKNEISSIEDLKVKLKHQKTNIEGSWIVKIPNKEIPAKNKT